MDGLRKFYIVKLDAQLRMYELARTEQGRDTIMAKLKELKGKSKRLLLELRNTNISPVTLMVLMAEVSQYQKAFEEVDLTIKEVLKRP